MKHNRGHGDYTDKTSTVLFNHFFILIDNFNKKRL